MQCTAQHLNLEIDPATGRWMALRGGSTDANWLNGEKDSLCGLPFVAATGIDRGTHIPMTCRRCEDGRLEVASESGRTTLTVDNTGYGIVASVTLPDRRGPRSGWCLDLNHLDLPGDAIENQVMPVCMQTGDDLSWSMIVWQRAEDDFLLTAFEGPFAGWAIRYSYAGHRMTGFDVLARADDVIAPEDHFPGGRLPATTRLKVHFAPASSVEEGIGRACEILGLRRVRPSQTSVVAGDCVRLNVGQAPPPVQESMQGQARAPVLRVDQEHTLEWLRPDGTKDHLKPGQHEATLDQPGVHAFTSTASNGRRYTTRVLAVGDWREMAERALAFHREHYQASCGAFARCINGASLKPEGFTFERVPFGDPDAHQSCRTGEFGGFGAWAQMIHMKHFGADGMMMASVRNYFDWITNKGREDNPRPNTICHTPHTFGGRNHGPYHFFQEINYAQHEAWLLEHFADTIDLGMDDLRDLFVKFSAHFLSEHIGEDGMVWNQNFAAEGRHDYSTVDAPLLHMLRAGRKLLELGEPLGKDMLLRVRRGVEHVYRRGFNFATEGESCTEDGSMACIAWTLAAAFNELDNPDPAWMELAARVMAFHAKLEMRGDDIRTDGSSIRFWETQYETDNYGPSINASHGWTLWSALARWELFRATGGFEHLWQAWRHSVNVAHRLRPDGGFPCCFTPDIIPAPPHADRWGADGAMRAECRMTTAMTGLGYTPTLSMSGMHLFIAAPQMWYRACGYDAATGRLVNARLVDGVLVPNTPLPCTRVGLAGPPRGDLKVTGLEREREVLLNSSGDVLLQGAVAVKRTPAGWTFNAPEGAIEIKGVVD